MAYATLADLIDRFGDRPFFLFLHLNNMNYNNYKCTIRIFQLQSHRVYILHYLCYQ